MFKRIFSLFIALVALFCVSVPALATGMEMGGTGIPINVNGNINFDVVEFFDYAAKAGTWLNNTIMNIPDKNICPYAPTLNGGHRFVAVRTMKNGQIGYYNQCEYCGKAYGDMLEEAYDAYTGELQDSFGTQPVIESDGRFRYVFRPDSVGYHFALRLSNGGVATTGQQVASSSGIAGHVYAQISRWDTSFGLLDGCKASFGAAGGSATYYVSLMRTFTPTVSGLLSFPEFSVPFRSSVASGADLSGSKSFSARSYTLVAGRETTITFNCVGSGSSPMFGGTYFDNLTIRHDVLGYIEPFGDVASEFADMRVASSVSASGDGMYGYIGGDGTLYQSTVRDIYNETTNVYQNPVTGDTSNISSWSYDYGARAYNLFTDEGDNINVTYGGDNITITDAGTTYNVYYLVEEPADVRDEPVQPPHVHDYSSAVTASPTCTGSGLRTYTCSGCGDSYAEVIPAIGHSFGTYVVTVPATCTGTGVQTATCSVCGETVTQSIPATGHSYSSEVTMEPTCTGTGVRTYTCADCGDVYTLSISATGHKWRMVRQVASVFDETGQLLSDGYTLYECDTCHEQYKVTADSDGTALPSPAPDGASTSGTDLIEINPSVGRGFLATIARGLTEDLPLAVQAASSWFETLPSLYSGYASFLRTAIVWLPDDIQALLRFGFGFPVFVGIIRKIWGR